MYSTSYEEKSEASAASYEGQSIPERPRTDLIFPTVGGRTGVQGNLRQPANSRPPDDFTTGFFTALWRHALPISPHEEPFGSLQLRLSPMISRQVSFAL